MNISFYARITLNTAEYCENLGYSQGGCGNPKSETTHQQASLEPRIFIQMGNGGCSVNSGARAPAPARRPRKQMSSPHAC